MIIETFESQRPKAFHQKNHSTWNWQQKDNSRFGKAQGAAMARNISLKEFWRRNQKVEKAVADCRLVVGKSYLPKLASKQDEYGPCVIKEICKDYFDVPISDTNWPEHDNPMVVTCKPSKGSVELFICTIGFLDPDKECSC